MRQRTARRMLVCTAVPLLIVQVGCAAQRVPMTAGPTLDAPAADRHLCEEAAVAQADGLAGRDPGRGAAEGVGLALHPVMVGGTMGLSLFLAPAFALPGAIAAGLEDRKLRKAAQAGALNACLSLAHEAQDLGGPGPGAVDRARDIGGRFRSLADASAAAGVMNNQLAQTFVRPGGPTATASDRVVNPAGDYDARARRDRVAAEGLYRRALAVQEEFLGPDHPDLADTLAHYAALLHALGRDSEAAPLEDRARGIRDRGAS